MTIERAHENNHSGHSHHHRSKLRNIITGAVQVPLAAVSGSFALAVAGGHNLVDGKVHDYRDIASGTEEPKYRRAARLKSAGLLAIAGAGAFTFEKLTTGHGNVPKWIVGIFAIETGVNVTGLIDDYKNGGSDTDTVASKLHNASDTLTSAATTVILGLPYITDDFESTAMDQLAGYGHLVLMGAVATYSLITASKD